MRTKEQVIKDAARAGSTATTFAGAVRYSRAHPRRFTMSQRGYHARRTTTRADWYSQAHRMRWEHRQDTLCREIMAAGRYLADRRRKPVSLLDRVEYGILADQRSADTGLPCITDCESMAASLTQPYLTDAAAALESAWPYRRSTSSWAGGEHDVRVTLGEYPSASCSTDKVWSDNGKWSGSNSSAMICTDLATLMEFPSLMTRDGLALCRARKIGTREYEVRWIEQSSGVSLKTVDGYLIRGYHVRAATMDQARKKAAKARESALSATIQARQQARSKRAGLATVRGVYLDITDSIAAGNCAPSTEQFAHTMWAAIGAQGPCAVRADVVLTARDDMYTRRALGAALPRYQHA